MNKVEVQQTVLDELCSLSLDQIEETLNFILSLKKGKVEKKSLGLLNQAEKNNSQQLLEMISNIKPVKCEHLSEQIVQNLRERRSL